MKNLVLSILASLAFAATAVQPADTDAGEIIRSAWEHLRGQSSSGEMQMTIHRPDWERTMAMRSWSQGSDKALVRVTKPRKDAGNATLTDDKDMWSFSPKVNRIIKVPSSMMRQRWMGSDFSNKDVSRSAEIVDEYDHKLLSAEQQDDLVVYVIESVPHEDSAVVWGKEVITIRDDYIILKHEFFDQAGLLVKTLETLAIEDMGGRATATRQRMSSVDTPDEWTEIQVLSVEYDIDLSDSVFTLSNLRNPRE
jgi:outer membrane lipoprotein-sorting protein